MASKPPLRVMVVGRGAREHALAWKLMHSKRVEHVFVVPGNSGTASGMPKVSNIDDVQMDEHHRLVDLARELRISLVVVGPYSPVIGGIEGYFHRANIPCFAPRGDAAVLGRSKLYAKQFMSRYGVPTAQCATFDDFGEAIDFVRRIPHRFVIKASGLEAGNNVVVPRNKEEALRALYEIMVERGCGVEGERVIIEEYLYGQEISVPVLCDGRAYVILPYTQHHRRISDGGRGPRTGGMIAFTPSCLLYQTVQQQIISPTLRGLDHQGGSFNGLLTVRIVFTRHGPKAMGYKTRFGDPEAQSIIPLLAPETDLAEIMLACLEKRLYTVHLPALVAYTCNIVITAGEYPEACRTHGIIDFEELRARVYRSGNRGCLIFHAGTKLEDGRHVTTGGRAFTIVGLWNSLSEAVITAYEALQYVTFPNMFFREDIGQDAISSLYGVESRTYPGKLIRPAAQANS